MTMTALFVHERLDDPIAHRNGAVITVAQYLADVTYCAGKLPDAHHVLLACQDRYAFAVGFGAAMLRRQISLLPSTHTEELIAKLAVTYPNTYCLTDEADCSIKLPQTNISEWLLQARPETELAVPHFPIEQVAALVFTSGSTGLPIAHKKTWGKLVVNVQSEGKRLGVVAGSGYTIIGTVPPQHMYGFESTVLIAMQNACAFESSKPFYPADIERVVAHTPRPRALVTTPFHLRTLLTELESPVRVDLLVSATAPLAVSLAVLAEQKMADRLLEIYGSTETSQLATRRTSETYDWTPFEGIHISQQGGSFFASGDQIEGSVEINDRLELKNDNFILHGRTVDMVNIAGKSTTLGYLNHQLLSIPDVEDGAFFTQSEKNEGLGNTTRLAAVVVAPLHTLESLQLALRKKVESAFLPRPFKLVQSLPRNSTGKLPHAELLKLVNSATALDDKPVASAC
jgi:acyl-coenzyme A synthetase/AMP-(fatty) acid ligase